jgi:Skp family chaperone for outer membrane proteins
MPNEAGTANADQGEANASAENQNTDGQSELTPEQLAAKDINQRLLAESQGFKKRALTAEQELAKTKKSQLESQQEYKKLYEETATELKQVREREVASSLSTSVSELAVKAGCVSVKDLMAVGDTSLLNYDAETGQVHGVDLFVEKAKREKPWLFSATKNTSVNVALPGAGGTSVGKEDYRTLSKDEIMKRLRALPKH